MKKILKYLFYRDMIQYKWGRRYFKGTYYHLYVAGLGIVFWNDKIITSCQTEIIKTESY